MITKKLYLITLAVSFSSFLMIGCQGTDHKDGNDHEHNGEEATEEQEEAMEVNPSEVTVTLTLQELADVVQLLLDEEYKKNGGYVVVRDSMEDLDLNLIMETINSKHLSSHSENLHFVCADFKTEEGEKYDLDIFMKGYTKDDLQPASVMVHKKGEEPRYAWSEEGGKLVRQDVSY